jgi:hypothetical protein
MIKFTPMSSTGRASTTNSILMYCTADDINDAFFGKTVSQFGVEEAY